MALPLTGITTSAVASTIGEASNDVGALFLSNKVNEWGFNCPETNLQNAIWGKPSSERAKLSPSDANFTPIPNVRPGYHLGAFRAYDHNWVAYTLGGIGMEGDDYNQPLILKIYIETAAPKLMSKPEPSPAIEHTCKIEFARSSQAFTNGTATIMDSSFIAKYPYSTIQFSPAYPPDYSVNGSLDEGETFYIKVTHISSPERRWANMLSNIFVNSFVTPESAFTNTYSLNNLRAIAVDRPFPAPAYYYFMVMADLYADYASARSMNFRAEMSNTSDFSVNVYNQYINNVAVPVNSTPGTKSFVQGLSFNFSTSGIASCVSNGDTVYWRIYVDGNLYNGGSTVVTDQLPVD